MAAHELHECGNCHLVFTDLELAMNHSCGEPLPSEVQESTGDATSPENGSTIHWTRKAVLQLIHLYRQNLELFRSPTHKKMDVWVRISQTLATKGHHYSGDACDKKFRSLQHRYRTIVSANKFTGIGRRRWEFFDLMRDVQELRKVEHQKLEQRHFVKILPKEELPSQVQENPASGMPSENCSTIHWTRKAVLQLIHLYRQNLDLFRSPTQKKMDVWLRISQTLAAKGHHYSGDACDKKFRSLQHRYRVLLHTDYARGRARPTWEYFDLMHELMSDLMAVEPQCTITVVSQDRTSSEPPERHKRPHPPLGPDTPPPGTSSSCPSEEEEGQGCLSGNPTAGHKSRRTEAEGPPPWFEDFLKEQRQDMARLRQLQEEAVELARERNAILRTFTEALLKK